jgi:hypothetical protein
VVLDLVVGGDVVDLLMDWITGPEGITVGDGMGLVCVRS